MRLLTSIFFALVLMGCNSGLPQTEIKKVENLQLKIDSSIEKIKQLDTVKIKEMYRHYKSNIEYLKTEYTDTVNTDHAYTITQYSGISTPLVQLKDKYKTVKNELQISAKQLSDLKHDAITGSLDQKHFERYISLETENVEVNQKNAEEMFRTYLKVKNSLEKLSPTIDSIIQSSKNKKEPA